jgi:putative membrane protein
MKRVIVGAVLVAVSVAWGLAGAARGQALQSSAQDQQFVWQAASDGLAEVELGQMAAERASNPAVQDFGQRMVIDHATANQVLTALAEAKHLAIPPGLSPQHQQTADTLANMYGASFDREYMRHMVTDHEKAVQLFTRAAQDSQDAEIRAFAAKTLPTLQAHLQMARQLIQQQGSMSQTR